MVNTRFWNDSYVADLDPSEKLLFLYLITNDRVEICGAYELPIKIMATETGIDKNMVEKIMQRFSVDGKVLYMDGWVFVLNYQKYVNTNNTNINIGIKRGIEKIPEETLNRLLKSHYRVLKSHERVLGNFNFNFNLSSKEDRIADSTAAADINKNETTKKTKRQSVANSSSLMSSESVDKSPVLFDADQWVSQLLLDKNRHIRVIGFFLQKKRNEFGTPDPSNQKESSMILKRHLRPAVQVGNFTNDKIEDAIDKAFSFTKEETTLDTVLKYLTK